MSRWIGCCVTSRWHRSDTGIYCFLYRHATLPPTRRTEPSSTNCSNEIRSILSRPLILTNRALQPHWGASVTFNGPSEQRAWKILLWDVPLRTIAVVSQPSVNLIGCLL